MSRTNNWNDVDGTSRLPYILHEHEDGILANIRNEERFPVFGRAPDAARWAFSELGLLLFMASVGLNGGAGLLETLVASGTELVAAGIAVTAVPVGIAYAWGRLVLKMNPLMLFGCITGSMTSGGALNAVNAEAKSSVTKELDYLVVGDEGSPLYGAGKKGSKLIAAEKLVAAGAPLQIISETDFLKLKRQ